MSATAKAFLLIFLVLAIGALAHDIYIWQNSNGFPFNFAALGWMAKTYYPDELQIVIDTIGADTFNSILTPVLKIPAFFLMGGIAAVIVAIDFIRRTIHNMNPGRGKDRDYKLKKYK